MSLALLPDSPEEEEQELRDLFNQFDADQGGSVSVDELVEQFGLLGVELSEDNCKNLLEGAGITANEVELEDFMRFMRYLERVSE